MQHSKELISAAIVSVFGVVAPQAHSALSANAILQFDPGIVTCIVGGTPPYNCTYGTTVNTGSYFSMDSNGNGQVSSDEKTALIMKSGIFLGISQAASNSHTGAPNGSEKAGIDEGWDFFSNTGLHQTTTGITPLSDDGAGTVSLDMTGWNVTWNAIPSIAMGGCFLTPNGCAIGVVDTGIGDMACYATSNDRDNDTMSSPAPRVDCFAGSFYKLTYAAHTPIRDPSGYGGALYVLNLAGSIVENNPPTVSSGVLAKGDAAALNSRTDMLVGMDDIVTAGGVADPDFHYAGGLHDFIVTGVTTPSVQVQLNLPVSIPADAGYRKFDGANWGNFVFDNILHGSVNRIASAPAVAGNCPTAGDAAYNHSNGLVAGDQCLQLTIKDNGPNDTNPATGTVADPGGITTGVVPPPPPKKIAKTDGCSLSANTSVGINKRADWWLVAGFLGLLGLWRRKIKSVR